MLVSHGTARANATYTSICKTNFRQSQEDFVSEADFVSYFRFLVATLAIMPLCGSLAASVVLFSCSVPPENAVQAYFESSTIDNEWVTGEGFAS